MQFISVERERNKKGFGMLWVKLEIYLEGE